MTKLKQYLTHRNLIALLVIILFGVLVWTTAITAYRVGVLESAQSKALEIAVAHQATLDLLVEDVYGTEGTE